MSIFGLIGGIGTLLFAGGGISALLLARKTAINLAEWFCLSWLLGACSISFLVWIGGIVCRGTLLQSLVSGVAIALAILGWKAFRRSGIGIRIPRPTGIIEWLLAVVLVAEMGTICWVSFKHTLGWDGLLVWEIKARYAFLNGGVLPQAYFQGIGRSFSHPDYPLGIPYTELWIYLWLGEANQFWAKIVFPVFYGVGSVLLALLGSRITGRRWIGLTIAVLLFFVPQASLSTGSAIVGYADFPLAIFYLASVGYLLCALRKEEAESAPWIFASCIACLPWIKNEGAILWVVAAAVAAILALTGRLPRRILFALVPGLVAALMWRAFLRVAHVASTSDFLPISKDSAMANLERLPSIYRVILAEFLDGQNWGLFWGVAALALIVLAWRWRYLTERLLILLIAVPLGLYSATYVFSSWPRYLDHVASSVPRLLMQLVPVTLLGMGVVLAEVMAANDRPAKAGPTSPAEGSLA